MSSMLANQASFRVAVITGGNSGLGYACALALLKAADGALPWHVVLACRDPDRAEAAVSDLRARAGSERVESMSLDLASLASVRSFAAELERRVEAGGIPALDALICCAGMQGARTWTADGFETTFGVNHLGHFLLVNLLLPTLSKSARVAVVSSGVHDPAESAGVPAPAWNDAAALARGELGSMAAKADGTSHVLVGRDTPYKDLMRRYSTSKLANIYFTYALARRLPGGVTVNAFDPGLMPGTGLAREASAPVRWLWHKVLPHFHWLLRLLVSHNIHTPEESGAALARLVSDPALANTTGRYFEGLKQIRSSPESYDEARAEALWQDSKTLTGLT
jgi:NAD(P)-dependent dehydrogenase (short-subunit alcohol dehydrogenase family)